MEETLNHPTGKTRAPYRKHGERVWALAREQYLAGRSARQVSEALGMTEYAIRQRIWREGWSKRAHAEAVADAVVAAALKDFEAGRTLPAQGGIADPADALEPRAAARAALDEAVRLMRTGRMAAAIEAARIADLLGRAAMRLGGETVEPEDNEEAFEAVRRKLLLGLAHAEEAPAGYAVHGHPDGGDRFAPLHHPSDGSPPPMGEE